MAGFAANRKARHGRGTFGAIAKKTLIAVTSRKETLRYICVTAGRYREAGNASTGAFRFHHPEETHSMFQTVIQILKTAAADRRGVTAMEYGLIAGVLAVGLATAFTALSGRLTNAFNVLAF